MNIYYVRGSYTILEENVSGWFLCTVKAESALVLTAAIYSETGFPLSHKIDYTIEYVEVEVYDPVTKKTIAVPAFFKGNLTFPDKDEPQP